MDKLSKYITLAIGIFTILGFLIKASVGIAKLDDKTAASEKAITKHEESIQALEKNAATEQVDIRYIKEGQQVVKAQQAAIVDKQDKIMEILLQMKGK